MPDVKAQSENVWPGPLRLQDSRRLTGPSIIGDAPVAIAEIGFDVPLQADDVEVLWREEMERLLPRVGWAGANIGVRVFSGGMATWLEAPIDVLLAATDVNELA